MNFKTLNVRGGLRDNIVKRESILSENKHVTLLLQEVHLVATDLDDFKQTVNKIWGEGNFEIYLSPHTNKSAGVLTLLPINDQVKFIETKELLPGRILNVIVEMNGETVNIINAYNYTTDHYKDQVTFFNILKQLDHTENYIIGGDINALMCIEKDRRSANKISYYGVKASSDFVNTCDQFLLLMFTVF